MIAPGESIYAYAQSPPPQAQPAANQQSKLMSPGQLDSLVAPIALYPDSLVATILAAATYPLQIVIASRWLTQNSNLKGHPRDARNSEIRRICDSRVDDIAGPVDETGLTQALVQAAGKQDWDPSIQALVAFPTVLQAMNQNLEWTTALGNAFLAQPADVMSAVQRMRVKAQQNGALQSNAQQQVQNIPVEGQPTVQIQPTNPEVVYVPVYDPAAVWGPPPVYYPYPAFYYPTGGVIAAGVIGFGIGVAVGAIFNGCCGAWGWGWGLNWGRYPSVYVNNNFFNHNGNTFVNRGRWGNDYVGNGNRPWNHNPAYRGAVPYTNRNVANRYNGGRAGSMRPPAQMPANPGNIKPPSGPGNANRLAPGNMPGRGGVNNPGSINRPGGRGATPGQLPANSGGNRPGAGTGSANRVAPGGQRGNFGGAGGNRFHGGGGFRGGGGSRGGGGFRGGGRRR
jgi:uncharacterized membrane protein YgcG